MVTFLIILAVIALFSIAFSLMRSNQLKEVEVFKNEQSTIINSKTPEKLDKDTTMDAVRTALQENDVVKACIILEILHEQYPEDKMIKIVLDKANKAHDVLRQTGQIKDDGPSWMDPDYLEK